MVYTDCYAMAKFLPSLVNVSNSLSPLLTTRFEMPTQPFNMGDALPIDMSMLPLHQPKAPATLVLAVYSALASPRLFHSLSSLGLLLPLFDPQLLKEDVPGIEDWTGVAGQ